MERLRLAGGPIKPGVGGPDGNVERGVGRYGEAGPPPGPPGGVPPRARGGDPPPGPGF